MANGDLTLQYTQWIKKIVRKMWFKYNKFYDYDELLAIGHLAALEAERRYDPAKAKFSAYIKVRVEGAIISNVSNISNGQHKVLQKMYKFIERYTQANDQPPAQHLILSHLKITEKEFLELLETILKITIVSPDDLGESDLIEDMDLDTLAEFSKVKIVIETLSKKQQRIINEFMEDLCEPSEEVKLILDILRVRLDIEEVE